MAMEHNAEPGLRSIATAHPRTLYNACETLMEPFR
jgi:hypothetical protein